ncbi:MAG: M48 family metallopeptidase [Verrucomicrobia bacterium]|nr:M48 family metallopeptidase [Verrucomicrobiota bacterium]
MTTFGGVCLGLILLRVLTALGLERINQRHTREAARRGPASWAEVMDASTHARSVAYTLAKSGFHEAVMLYGGIVLIAVLFSGVLPWGCRQWAAALGSSNVSLGLFVVAVGLGLCVLNLPMAAYAQFGLEERFGFNTMTPRLWWADRLKGWALSAAIGYPLLLFILGTIAWAGPCWWLWAWGAVVAVQFVLWIVGPIWILPLFNKLTPLPDDDLRRTLLALADQAGFPARNVQVMDGSRRSRHSNAFFTGFGRGRKIVLYDTLLDQLNGRELQSVLAHELGHYHHRHLQKLFLAGAAGMLAGFGAVAWLIRQDWFYEAFGFEIGLPAIGLFLCALLQRTVSFWIAPVANWWSRRFEYQADAFAARLMGETGSMIAALRGLAAKNLSNLAPHPLYSRFHYSHPTLREREAALQSRGS